MPGTLSHYFLNVIYIMLRLVTLLDANHSTKQDEKDRKDVGGKCAIDKEVAHHKNPTRRLAIIQRDHEPRQYPTENEPKKIYGGTKQLAHILGPRAKRL